jgi:hypothetical protein
MIENKRGGNMKTVWVVTVDEDGSFVCVCQAEGNAQYEADKYKAKYGNRCGVYEEELK